MMRLVSMEFVQPGATLGKTIVDLSNRPLLNAGVSLSSSYIRKLREMGYSFIYIDDPLTYDISAEEYVPEVVKNKVITEVRRVFTNVRESNRIERSISDKAAYALVDLFKEVIDSVNGNALFELHMGAILNKDANLLEHSFNVALYSSIIATANQATDVRVKEIGVGALLHDVGKIAIPEAILNKPGKLTAPEWEEMKKHTTIGYDIIRKQPSFSILSAHCALQHHERLDGSGYPRGLTSENIHEVGKIVAIADVFDAMTAPRPYKQPYLASDVLEHICADAGSLFDVHLVELFRLNVAVYPVGVEVKLSDGREGVVVKNAKEFPSRPTVRILSDNGNTVSPYDMDLSSTSGVVIMQSNQETILQIEPMA